MSPLAVIVLSAALLGSTGASAEQTLASPVPRCHTPGLHVYFGADDNLDGVYYYRWSTHKRALRYTTAGAGYIATEYDNPITYSFNGTQRAATNK